MPKSSKPTSLLELYKSLEPLYAPWHNKLKRARDTYYKRFHNQLKLPAGVPVHEASTARNLVDNLADQIRTDEPRITFDAEGTSRKAQDHKELMELWGQKTFSEISQHTLLDVWEQAKHDLIRDSAACVKFLVDVDALPDEPAPGHGKEYREELEKWKMLRAQAWPYDIQAVDPYQVFISPGRKRPPLFVLERQQRLEEEVLLDYPEYKPKEERGYKRQALRLVDWLEYWSADHYIVEVDAQRIIDKPNPYGVIPYAWEYNGLGRHDYTGGLEFLGEPVLESVMGELEEEVRIKTAMGAQWQYHVFPRLITTLSATIARRMFMTGPGAIITVPDMNQSPRWLEVMPPNAQMIQFLEEIKQSIANRFPPSLNQRAAGVDAAIHQALLLGQAVKPLSPIKNAMNRLATTVLRGMAAQAHHLYLDMTVYGKLGKSEKNRMVSHDDFTSFNFHVNFEATDPEEDDRKLLTGSALLRIPGLLSNQSFYEKFGAGLGISYDEEQVRLMTEQVIKMFVESGLLTQEVVQEVQRQEQQAQEQGLLGAARSSAVSALTGSESNSAPPVPGARERNMAAAGGAPPTEAMPGAQEALQGGTQA